MSRDGNGVDFDANAVSLSLIDKYEAQRSQYFMLSGIFSEYETSTSETDSDALSLAYGQVWQGKFPGSTYNLGVFAGNGWIDSAAPTDSDNSTNVGVLGGLSQIIGYSDVSAWTLGSSFSLAYLYMDGEPDNSQGFAVAAYPYLQYNRILCDDLMAYGRLGGTISSEPISMDGDKQLVTPSLGLDYKFDDYILGAQYTHEFNSDHNGNVFGLSISRSF